MVEAAGAETAAGAGLNAVLRGGREGGGRRAATRLLLRILGCARPMIAALLRLAYTSSP